MRGETHWIVHSAKTEQLMVVISASVEGSGGHGLTRRYVDDSYRSGDLWQAICTDGRIVPVDVETTENEVAHTEHAADLA